MVLLVDQSTARAGEVFAAALDGNKRAEMIGEHTLGSAARQRLVKLPDGSAMLLSYLRYLAPDGNAIHEKGFSPKCRSMNRTSSSARSRQQLTSRCSARSNTSRRRKPLDV